MDAMVENCNELTGAEYWDEQWKAVGRDSRILSPRHGRDGRNGYIMRMMRRHVPDVAGRNVLEVGGGGGAHRLLALAKWGGARAHAVDYSAVGLKQTEAVFRANGCELKSHLANLYEWDADGQRFDLIIHWGVIEHFRDPAAIFEHSARLLTSTGHMLFSMPNMEAWGAALWRRWAPVNWSYHIYHSLPQIRDALESAGLELTDSFHYGPPLLQICPWETGGMLKSAVTVASKAATSASWILPIYSRGFKRVSQERGFLARKAS